MLTKEFNKQAESLAEIGYSIIEKLAREVMDKDKRISSLLWQWEFISFPIMMDVPLTKNLEEVANMVCISIIKINI